MTTALLLLALAATPPETAPTPATPPAAPATTDEERLRQVQERRAALERELQRLRGEERSLLGEVERLELELRLRTEELEEIQLSLRRTRAQLEATLTRVRHLEQSLAAARPALAAHARALYKLGELSYLRLLLSVDHPSDFFRGYRFVTALARRDNRRVAAFRTDLQALTDQRAELEKKTRESVALRSRLQAARRNLDEQRERKTALLTSIVERKELHAAYVDELAEAETRLRQMLLGLGGDEAAVPIAAFRGSLPWPVSGRLRSAFGRRRHPRFETYTVQNGIEIEAQPDTPVRAVHEGTVVFADRFRGYGLMVVLDHGGKHHSLYAQLGELRVTPGQRVAAGEVVGTSGSGGVEGPGVYFEMRHYGRAADPVEWLTSP